MKASLRLVASSATREISSDDEFHESALSGVRPACPSEGGDDIDQAFETLESGAPPRGLVACEDPLARIESDALLRNIALVQLRELHERMDELAVLPAAKGWRDAVRLLLDGLRAVAAALDLPTLIASLVELELVLARAADPRAAEGAVRDALWIAHARLVRECAFVLAWVPKER